MGCWEREGRNVGTVIQEGGEMGREWGEMGRVWGVRWGGSGGRWGGSGGRWVGSGGRWGGSGERWGGSVDYQFLDTLVLFCLSFRAYFIAVAVSGIFAVTFSIVFAYVADCTSEVDRSSAYGLVCSVYTDCIHVYLHVCHQVTIQTHVFAHRDINFMTNSK